MLSWVFVLPLLQNLKNSENLSALRQRFYGKINVTNTQYSREKRIQLITIPIIGSVSWMLFLCDEHQNDPTIIHKNRNQKHIGTCCMKSWASLQTRHTPIQHASNWGTRPGTQKVHYLPMSSNRGELHKVVLISEVTQETIAWESLKDKYLGAR